MRYNLSDEFGRRRFETRCSYLVSKGLRDTVIVELTDISRRSLDQNNYLHLLLGCLALHLGLPLKETKEEIYKATVNPDIFVQWVEIPSMGRVRELKSSSKLTVEEMSTSITKLRNWASLELGVYLPEPNEEQALKQLADEIDRYSSKVYL